MVSMLTGHSSGSNVTTGADKAATAGRGSKPAPATAGANEVWAWDFVFDACANGQQLKCLTVIDEYTPTVRSGNPAVPREEMSCTLIQGL